MLVIISISFAVMFVLQRLVLFPISLVLDVNHFNLLDLGPCLPPGHLIPSPQQLLPQFGILFVPLAGVGGIAEGLDGPGGD